jgi:hypothetical protein
MLWRLFMKIFVDEYLVDEVCKVYTSFADCACIQSLVSSCNTVLECRLISQDCGVLYHEVLIN